LLFPLILSQVLQISTLPSKSLKPTYLFEILKFLMKTVLCITTFIFSWGMHIQNNSITPTIYEYRPIISEYYVWHPMTNKIYPVDCDHLDCDAILSCRRLPTFWKDIIAPSSGSKLSLKLWRWSDTCLQTADNYIQDHKMSQPRRLQLTYLLPWEPHILNST
jgi:hypothetical protein